MAQRWASTGVVPVDLTDGTVEALACIYVGRLAGMDPADVVLGDYEHAVVLVTQAELAVCEAEGVPTRLVFSGPPLQIDVAT